jgi:hypothetical protein
LHKIVFLDTPKYRYVFPPALGNVKETLIKQPKRYLGVLEYAPDRGLNLYPFGSYQ